MDSIAILETNEMSLRIAVVGLVHGEEYFAPAQAHPRACLAALVDIDAERRSRLAEMYNVAAFASIDEMLAAKAADAVIIATPTQWHAPMSAQCLDAGLHVMLCKPLCRNEEEAAVIGAAVARNEGVFQVGYQFRSSPLHTAVLEHIQRGDLGDITNVWYNEHCDQSENFGTWRESRKAMGGKLFDCAVHFLDLMQQWAGAPVHRLVALGHVKGKTGLCRDELPDSAAISIEYANGVRGTFNFGAVNRFNDEANFGIAGTTGRIMGNPNHAGSYELRQQRGLRVADVVIDPHLTGVGHLGMREEFDNFVKTVLDGAPNVCSFEDALALHRQMEAIDQSLATGQVIEL